jgi:transcriptional regulator with XRE-family HTH domain
MEIRASERVAAWRKTLGWNVKQLAEAAGIHKATLYRIDNGKQEPTVAETELLAAAMGLTLPEFFGELPASEAAAVNG